MKEKIIAISARYLVVNLAFLPVLVALRLLEYSYLAHDAYLQEHALVTELSGLLFDFRALVVLGLVMFIPVLLLALLDKRVGIWFYMTLLGLLTLLQFSLISYYAINLAPLDDVLFRYSFGEVQMIVSNSGKLDLWSFLPMGLLVVFFGFLQWLGTRIRWKPRNPGLLVTTYMAALVLALVPPPVEQAFDSESAFYHRVNKSSYFLRESMAYMMRERQAAEVDEIKGEIEHYQGIHPEFDFTSTNYPILYRSQPRDVLGPRFNLGTKPPNLVFIIVESLSSACMGEKSWYGNFTPFLDSLAGQSLYWDNFLSSSERTFHVFASLFGSLPYGDGEFQENISQMPFHYSIIRYLREHGYFTGFYYGGDASFTNYDQFLNKQGIDFIMGDIGLGFSHHKKLYPDFSWGYHDQYTFANSLHVLDSVNREPRLDIYLTLSTHHPFHPPNADRYLEKYETITTQADFPAGKKRLTDLNREIFSSMLYTDDALRDFFKAYSKRADFDNTIFFITGDHFFMELGYSSISAIERYHVPMIIYSPLLKEPHHFSSVSSHNDITPSVIEMLAHRYGFREHHFLHWLGQGLDTSANFRNTSTMAFVTSDREQVDFLKGTYFLSKNRLYRLKPGLRTEPVEDEARKREMKKDLDATTTVHRYVNETDHVTLRELFRPIEFDTVPILSFDTAGFVFGEKPNLYLALINPYKFDTSCWKIWFSLEFQFMIQGQEDKDKLPRLIASINDTLHKNYLYHQLLFPEDSTKQLIPGEWYPYTISDVLDVSSIDAIQGKILNLYFFNNRLSTIRFDSVNFKMNGIF